MAVNSITFGEVNSADYGIYISGEGVFNAPKRDVEMISIPGRNGAFALDKGRFENIEVTYPAFNFEPDDYATFAQNLSDFRNAISSLRGYQRLTDTFHPNEYRMATYISGLEVKPIKYNTASEFNIAFDCKPQRYLLSGEEAVTVASGGTLTNPTLFDASPMLEVEGYGTIGFNGYEIELENGVIGTVPVADAYTGQMGQGGSTIYANRSLFTLTDDMRAKFNSGDVITIPAFTVRWEYIGGATQNVSSLTKVSDSLAGASTTVESAPDNPYGTNVKRYNITVNMPSCTIPADISRDSVIQNQTTFTATTTHGNVTETLTTKITYNSYNKIVYLYSSFDDSSILYSWYYPHGVSVTMGAITGYSTISVMGDPTYIDCDLGECYLINDGTPVSLNQHIDLGSDLPKLSSGANEITYDNTITDLEIIPRWWKL